MGERVPLSALPPAARAQIVPGSPAWGVYVADAEKAAGLPAGWVAQNNTFDLKPGADALKVLEDAVRNAPRAAAAGPAMAKPESATGAGAIPQTAAGAAATRTMRQLDSDREKYKPVGDHWYDNVVPAIGKNITDTWMGLKQWAGVASPEDVAEKDRLDAPLANAPGGTAGQIIGGAAQTAIPASGLLKMANVARGVLPAAGVAGALSRAATGPAAQGAVLGAGYEAAQPVREEESRGLNALQGAGTGAVGAVLPAAVAAAGRPAAATAIQMGKPAVAALADKAAAAGIDLRASQVSPNKWLEWATRGFDSLPFSNTGALADKQRSQYMQALARSTGADTDDLVAAMRDSRVRLGNGFNALNSRNQVQLDPWHVDAMNDIADNFMKNDISKNKELTKRLRSIQRSIVENADHQGVLDGTQYQKARTRLGADANSGEATPDYRDALDAYKSVLDRAFDSGLSPADRAEKDLLRRQWSNMKTLEPIMPTAADGDVDVKALARVMNSRNISNSANAAKLKYGTGDQELADLARIGSTFLSNAPRGGGGTFGSSPLGQLGKAAITPATVGGGLYALNSNSAEEGGGSPVVKTAGELGALMLLSSLAGRGVNSRWFSRGSKPLVKLGEYGQVYGAGAPTGALASLKANTNPPDEGPVEGD